MSGEQRAYVRVYWTIIDDPKFCDVYDDDRHLACWLRLLIIADQSWPASAPVPASARRASFDALVRAGLVDRMPGDRFRIHGLDAERNGRMERGRAGASARWERPQSERNADALHGHSGRAMQTDASRAEPSIAEPSPAPAREGLPSLHSTVAALWEEATGRGVLASGAYAAEYLDDACRRHPPSEVGAAVIRARRTFAHIPDAAQMVAAMRPLLDPLPDPRAARAAGSDAERSEASRRRVEATLERTHDLGAHAGSPNPRCPKCRGEEAA